MIDPNFWASQDVARLNLRQRLLAIGLFSNADDEGRGIADPAYVRATVFPYDNFSLSMIKKDLEILCQELNLCIYFYESDQKRAVSPLLVRRFPENFQRQRLYYAWMNWRKWQRVEKPQTSAIPAPPCENSGNDSGNDSGKKQESFRSDSGLKERKGKEDKRKEEEEEEGSVYKDRTRARAHAREEAVVEHTEPPSASSLFSLIENEKRKRLTTSQKNEFNSLLDSYDPEIIQEAIRRAAIRDKPGNIGYISAILEDWRVQGWHSLPAVMASDPGAKGAKRSDCKKLGPCQPRADPEREKWVQAAVDYIRLTLGENPGQEEARKIAEGYGLDIVPDVMKILFGKGGNEYGGSGNGKPG